ncbi:PREDICTED: uncharacterized protein LOC108972635 isoform X1 [Bactrocera latifrons]|uniref:Transcription factor Adf-1 n=2 Tax=Bactrocera latifrons TaxID=174628 RepID=A0A0K8U6L8_BACLA|nr:PREDICTED: uncharacterized protein LOC108972635 isoform X1 [Bactrocera latifrons]
MLVKMDNFEKIIEMVEINPCLYDKRDEKYKDFKHKERVWQEIANQVNLSARNCKVKWKSLRDKYRKMKLSEDQPSGSGHTWKYMESLEFLTETMDPISTNTNAKMDTTELLVDEQILRTTTKQKRCNDDLFNDVLKAMKRKYEGPQTSNNNKYEHFFGMLGNKLDKLTESEVDEVEIEILNLVNQKLNASRKTSKGIYR